jgi:predicted phage terminase large subunit-like protein
LERTRRAATNDLISFTEYTFPSYAPAAPHRQIAEQLQRVERGEVDRLMLCVPPRHGKSELASRRFPAWYLGRHPDKQFISASASVTLAEDFGRDVRNLIASPEYAEVFETRLSEDSQAKGRWMTDSGGSYFATGVGGALMGRGAHIALIDDPFGSMADARSEPQRKALHDWYTGTLYNRLEKNGAIVVIAHRMHQDDLSGRLLAQQAAGGDKWEVVELKAVLPDGRALWPEKFDAAALARVKANTTAKDWSALYQQEPTPDSGSYFRDEWLFPYVGDPPPFMNVYGASDFAVTSEGGDWTVHVVIGIDPNGHMYLLDLWRQQTSSKIWIEAYCDLVVKHKPMWWAFEIGQIVAGLEPFIKQRSIERQAYASTEKFPTKGDKAIRSQSIRGRMELQGLYVPAAAKWLPDLRAELTAFPESKHDDQVDALGLVGQLMDRYVPGYIPKKPDNEKWPGYSPMYDSEKIDSWRML